MKNKCLIIFGPTSSGKTKLALEVANYLRSKNVTAEIINADSRQVYKMMDIGTNKPSKSIMEKYAHHLLDLKNPDQVLSNDEYTELAKQKLLKIWERGNIPILVGGTGTCVFSLFGYQYIKNAREKQPFIQADTLMLVPHYTRDSIFKRIDDSVDKMFLDGLYDEVKNILRKYNSVPIQLKKTIGYQEFFEHSYHYRKDINKLGYIDLEKIKWKIKRDTKNYARRQDNWFKKLKNYKIIESSAELKRVIGEFIF